MMKKLAAMIMIVGLAGVAPADYYINFTSYWGNYDTDGSTPLLPDVGDKATVQLIYAGADGIANELSFGGGVSGDDVLLYSSVFTNTGGLYEDFAAGTFGTFDGTAFLGSSMYGRILIDEGLKYYVGAIENAEDLDSSGGGGLPPLPHNYDLTPLSPQPVIGIPEPASLVLMGSISLGTFLIRRIFRIGGFA